MKMNHYLRTTNELMKNCEISRKLTIKMKIMKKRNQINSLKKMEEGFVKW